MKKTIFILAMALPVMFASCSDTEEGENTNIILDKTTINIPYQGEEFVSISGADEYNIKVDDEYFITASYADGGMRIFAFKVGTTRIVVSNKNTEVECIVNVTPVIDYIGIPIIAFGENKEYILSQESNEQLMDYEDRISFVDKEIPFWANHTYHFDNGKLNYILTKIEIPNSNGGNSLSMFLERVGESLQERYSFLEAYSGIHQDIYIYTFKNEYYIGARLRGGNGGWYICYAESLEQLKDILDIHPSLEVS